jgi:hypothetical protein
MRPGMPQSRSSSSKPSVVWAPKGIEAVVLQLICPHLVGETKPAAFPGQTENGAAAEVFEQRQSEPKLFPAVATP